MADDYNAEKSKSGKLGILRDEKIRVGVIAGIIASVIVIIFVNPILHGVWTIIVEISSQIYSGFVDAVYQSAAFGSQGKLDFKVIFSFRLSLAVFLIFLLVYFKDVTDRNKQEFLELIGEAPQREEKDLEKLKEKVKESFKLLKRLLIVGWVLLPITIFSGFLALTADYVDLKINTSFRQRIAVLAPYISEDREESLFAQWALMRTRKDYLKLTSEMDKMAQELKIELPKPLLD